MGSQKNCQIADCNKEDQQLVQSSNARMMVIGMMIVMMKMIGIMMMMVMMIGMMMLLRLRSRSKDHKKANNSITRRVNPLERSNTSFASDAR